jgi:hypothetical protein
MFFRNFNQTKTSKSKAQNPKLKTQKYSLRVKIIGLAQCLNKKRWVGKQIDPDSNPDFIIGL